MMQVRPPNSANTSSRIIQTNCNLQPSLNAKCSRHQQQPNEATHLFGIQLWLNSLQSPVRQTDASNRMPYVSVDLESCCLT